MTKDEFDERQAKLRFEYSCRKTAIEEEYVSANRVAKPGDIVCDNFGKSIKVNEVRYSMYSGKYPSIYYYGVVLTKKGEPNKRGETFSIYQERIATVNGEKVDVTIN